MTFNPTNTDYSYEKIGRIIRGYIQKSNRCQDNSDMKQMIGIQLSQLVYHQIDSIKYTFIPLQISD